MSELNSGVGFRSFIKTKKALPAIRFLKPNTNRTFNDLLTGSAGKRYAGGYLPVAFKHFIQILIRFDVPLMTVLIVLRFG